MASAAKKQDMPPPGGYRPINYQRIPARTYFSGYTLFGAYLGITAGAAYLYYLNCKLNKREEIEMRSARLAITPMLLAERDREFLKQLRRNRDEEAQLMANVEGWKVGTLYGEPLYTTVSDDKLIEPTMQGYYIHSDWRNFRKRAYLSEWS